MRKWMTVVGIASLFCLLPASDGSAQKTEDLMKMDLEDIMGMDVTVFSVQGLTQRQTPGVLTVIDDEEIRRSGARDLVDVLRLVPGFDFGVDVQSAVGLGIRGLWAQEGKVLLLLDGLEMNEILFSCLALGDHFPVEHLKRVEIIRGPGTSFYGGYAELSVINLVSKAAVDLRGIETSVSYGFTASGESRKNLSLNFGRKFGALKVKALSYLSRSQRSDRTYTDLYGNGYSMQGNSSIRPAHVNVGLAYKTLEASVLIDRYVYDMMDGMDSVIERPFGNAFNSYAGRIRYDAKIGRSWTVSPYCVYLRQEPWKIVDPASMEYEWYSYVIAERIKGGFTARGPVGENIQVVAGGEAFEDRGSVTEISPEWDYFSGGAGSVRNRQAALFAQAFYTRGNTVPSIGLRYDRHNLFGAEFLPWIGVTRIFGKWSLKALFGQTFRAPSLENLDLNRQIKPEKTTTGELEIGFQASDNLYFIADFFETRIKGPIVYFYDPSTNEESYGNYRKVGSRGVEIESRWKADWGYLNASYSFYRPVNMIDSYRIEGKPGFFLGFSNHKASLSGHFKLGRVLSFNPTLAFYGHRYGYTRLDADSMGVISEFKPSLLANCCVQADRPFGMPFDVSMGVYNAFDSDVPFIQPYDSGHAPLPGLSREFVVNLRYRLQW